MTHHVEGAFASKWQNPFTEQDYGLEKCVELYEEHVRTRLIDSIEELAGKKLGCWCRPTSLCHADVLIKIYDEMYGSKWW